MDVTYHGCDLQLVIEKITVLYFAASERDILDFYNKYDKKCKYLIAQYISSFS